MTIKYLDDNMNVIIVNAIIIDKVLVNPLFDTHIHSVEVENGWLELWNVDGFMCVYFVSDDC